MSLKKTLIIHIPIPFAQNACLCDTARGLIDAPLQTRKKYLQALSREMLSAAGGMEDYEIAGIVLDGGDIQAFPPGEVTVFVERLKRNYNIAKNPVVTLSCDPTGIDPIKAANYRQLGATLIDLRLFSAVRDECQKIGRVFPHYTLKEPALALRRYLLPNIGVQVAMGIADQTKTSLRYTLEQCEEYNAAHISLLTFGDVEKETDDFAREWLASRGYARYAPGRYAKPGWEMPFYPLGSTDVLAFGLNAQSYMDGLCSRNTGDMELYLAAAQDYSKITVSVKPMARDL